MKTESGMTGCARCGTRYDPLSSAAECPHAWQRTEPAGLKAMREQGPPYVREPWQPDPLRSGAECPACKAARAEQRHGSDIDASDDAGSGIAEGYLNTSAERPGQLVCNACGRHFGATPAPQFRAA